MENCHFFSTLNRSSVKNFYCKIPNVRTNIVNDQFAWFCRYLFVELNRLMIVCYSTALSVIFYISFHRRCMPMISLHYIHYDKNMVSSTPIYDFFLITFTFFCTHQLSRCQVMCHNSFYINIFRILEKGKTSENK